MAAVWRDAMAKEMMGVMRCEEVVWEALQMSACSYLVWALGVRGGV